MVKGLRKFSGKGERMPNYTNRMLLRDMWRLMRPYKWKFVMAAIFRLICDLAWLYPAYALASVINFFARYTPGQSVEELWWILGLWVVASFIRFVFIDTAKYFAFQVAEKMALDAQYQTLAHLTKLDSSWHERENSGNKLKRILKGMESINIIPRLWINNFSENIVNFVGIITVVGIVDIAISGVMLIFFVTYFTISFFLTRRAARASYAVNIAEEEVAGVSYETIHNIRSVNVLAMDKALLEIISSQLGGLFGKIRRRLFWHRSRQAVLGLVGQSFRLGTVFIIVWGILQGRYEVGFLVLFYEYFNRLWEAIREFSESTQQYVDARYGIARMMQILQEPIGISDEHGKRDMPAGWNTLHLEKVSFAYGTKQVLQDLTFDIRRGEKIGIVGLSGAGKSTLIKLLLKEYENFSGAITFDDVPIQDIRKSSYFGHTAVVLQDTEVFNFSLRDNITIANMRRAADVELFERSMEIAHVTDFIHKLPEGIDTLIGEKGIKLSGGERQRLGIARAIFKEPELLLLDEATSHLDVESEEKIQDSLHQFFETVTAVVIAHRLTTIRQMDRILVMEGGRIVESGSFDELYATKGRFFELWEKQKF